MVHRINTISEFDKLIKKGHPIVDLRNPDEFSSGFIPGSLCLPLNHFEHIANHFLYADMGIVFISGKEEDTLLGEFFQTIKLNNVIGLFSEGYEKWKEAERSIDLIISIEADELLLEINHGKMTIIDIRPSNLYHRKHIKDSVNMQVKDILKNRQSLSEIEEVCMLCDDGFLSLSLISYLKINGIHHIYHLSGGFKSTESTSGLLFNERKTNKRPPASAN